MHSTAGMRQTKLGVANCDISSSSPLRSPDLLRIDNRPFQQLQVFQPTSVKLIENVIRNVAPSNAGLAAR